MAGSTSTSSTLLHGKEPVQLLEKPLGKTSPKTAGLKWSASCFSMLMTTATSSGSITSSRRVRVRPLSLADCVGATEAWAILACSVSIGRLPFHDSIYLDLANPNLKKTVPLNSGYWNHGNWGSRGKSPGEKLGRRANWTTNVNRSGSLISARWAPLAPHCGSSSVLLDGRVVPIWKQKTKLLFQLLKWKNPRCLVLSFHSYSGEGWRWAKSRSVALLMWELQKRGYVVVASLSHLCGGIQTGFGSCQALAEVVPLPVPMMWPARSELPLSRPCIDVLLKT